MSEGIFMQQPLPTMHTTLLFGIEPRGLGTDQVESLFSHLLGLAYAHGQTPNKLVNAILPTHPEVNAALSPGKAEKRIMRRIQHSGYGWGWGWDKDAGKHMISAGPSSAGWARALAIATGIEGLEAATLTGLSRHVSSTELVTKAERVCLRCLRDDVASGQMPYGRLLWRMGCVACCPVHKVALVPATCGRPGSTTLNAYTRVKHSGICTTCGSVGYQCIETARLNADDSEVWRAGQCAQVLRNLNAISLSDPEATKSVLRAHAAGGEGLVAFAARVGAPKSIISRWLNKPKARVSIRQLLDIAAVQGWSLSGLLQGRIEAAEVPCPMPMPTRNRRVNRRVNHEALRAAMTEALESGKTATQVAVESNVDVGTLARHKDLYKQLRKTTAERTASRSWAQQHEAVAKAEFAVLELKRQGLELTLRNAASVTGTPWYPSAAESKAFVLIQLASSNLLDQAGLVGRVGASLVEQAAQAAQRLR